MKSIETIKRICESMIKCDELFERMYNAHTLQSINKYPCVSTNDKLRHI